MPITNIRKLLIDLAKKEKEESKIAKILAFYYPSLNLKDKKTLFESLLSYYRISENTEIELDNIPNIEDEDELEGLNGKDYRIKSIEISDLRGIPNKDENGIAFGMDFTEDDVINNAVILANNGNGKSSIFAGMEMIYAQEIGEKRLRVTNPQTLKKNDYHKYLKRFPAELKPLCVINTNEGYFDLENITFENDRTRRLLNPANHFISDFDIYKNGQKEYDGTLDNENSFHSLIATSLGLKEFMDIQTRLREVSSYRRLTEKNSVKKLEKERDKANHDIINAKAEIQSKEINLQELNDKSEKDTATASKTISERINRLNEFLNKPFYYNIDKSNYLGSLAEFQSIYRESLSISRNERKTTELDFLDAGLDLLHKFDNCPFCQSSKKSLEEIQDEVQIRLNKLKDSQKFDEKLRKAFFECAESIVSFFQSSTNIYNLINEERNHLIGFSELSSLSSIEEDLYMILSPFIQDMDLSEKLRLLNSKSFPSDEDYKNLFNTLNDTFDEKKAEIIEKIHHFINSRKEIIEATIDLISKDSTAASIVNQVAVLEEDIKRLKLAIKEKMELAKSLDADIEKAVEDASLVTRVKKEVIEFIGPLDSEINKLVNEAFNPIKEIIETILNDYLLDDHFSLRINKEEIKRIIEDEEILNNIIQANIEYIDKETGEVVTDTPDKIFNTFRYKLFCLMVSLSLALATRKKYNVNLPLVMDDLFFASDFISKNSFAEFLQKVIGLFYKYTPNLPLQFILFTHDDLIFRSALDAIETFNIEIESEFCEENKKSLFEKTMIGRLFNPKDKDEIPSKFENSKSYWNLLYKLPKKILIE